MDRFRIVPPARETTIEKSIVDDMFEFKATNYVKKQLGEMDCTITGKHILTTAHGLKIFRCQFSSPSDEDRNGIIVFWNYENGDSESSVYFGLQGLR